MINNNIQGFSLVELVIVMAIIAILSLMAYPSYTDYITRSRRTDAQTALMDLASRMESYYSGSNTYQTATIATGANSDVLASNTSPQGFYTLSITEQTQSSFTLQAIPLNAQITADTLCQTLTLNNLGIKGITTGPTGITPTGSVERCW